MPAVFLSSAGDGGLALMLVIIFALTVYFFPALVAIVREHGNAASIALTNFFFGWTFVGWVVALIWAFSDNSRKTYYPANHRE